ncbi:Tol [Fusarium pseudocircinatum]|uniref:Tol n=1 Tax=Fusarium pseudocircinatum TaxID=56676 RepID=A0A8H5L549_9HYPO|nr:Tol [Fusarium pseudocircinatum]
MSTTSYDSREDDRDAAESPEAILWGQVFSPLSSVMTVNLPQENKGFLGKSWQQAHGLQPGALPEKKTSRARGQELDPDDERIQALIARREADGYTIIRHLRQGFTQSNFGTGLQILDRDLALMNLTYANAWQFGKSLAMGDTAFSTALAHLRNSIYGQGRAAAKREVHSGLGGFQSRAKTAAGMLDLVHGRPQPAQQIALQSSPSYLPEETLRFFHVDENWTDALIDGALSLANHWGDEPNRDIDRTAIKNAIDTRLSKPGKALGG